MIFDVLELLLAYAQYMILLLSHKPTPFIDWYTDPLIVLSALNLDAKDAVASMKDSFEARDLADVVPASVPLDLRFQFLLISIMAPMFLCGIAVFFLAKKTFIIWFLAILVGTILVVSGTLYGLLPEPLVDTAQSDAYFERVWISGTVVLALPFVAAIVWLIRSGIRKMSDGEYTLMLQEPIEKHLTVAEIKEEETKDPDYIGQTLRLTYIAFCVICGLMALRVIDLPFFPFLGDLKWFGIALASLFFFLALGGIVWGVLSLFKTGREWLWQLGTAAQNALLSLSVLVVTALYVPIGSNIIRILNCAPSSCPSNYRLPDVSSSFVKFSNAKRYTYPTSENFTVDHGAAFFCQPKDIIYTDASYGPRTTCPMISGDNSDQRIYTDRSVHCTDTFRLYMGLAASLMLVAYIVGLAVLDYMLITRATDAIENEYPLDARQCIGLDFKQLLEEKLQLSDNVAKLIYGPFVRKYRYWRMWALLHRFFLIWAATLFFDSSISSTSLSFTLSLGFHTIMLFCMVTMQPYQNRVENWFGIATQTMLSIVSALGLGSSVNDLAIGPEWLYITVAVMIFAVPLLAVIIGGILTKFDNDAKASLRAERIQNAIEKAMEESERPVKKGQELEFGVTGVSEDHQKEVEKGRPLSRQLSKMLGGAASPTAATGASSSSSRSGGGKKRHHHHRHHHHHGKKGGRNNNNNKGGTASRDSSSSAGMGDCSNSLEGDSGELPVTSINPLSAGRLSDVAGEQMESGSDDDSLSSGHDSFRSDDDENENENDNAFQNKLNRKHTKKLGRSNSSNFDSANIVHKSSKAGGAGGGAATMASGGIQRTGSYRTPRLVTFDMEHSPIVHARRASSFGPGSGGGQHHPGASDGSFVFDNNDHHSEGESTAGDDYEYDDDNDGGAAALSASLGKQKSLSLSANVADPLSLVPEARRAMWISRSETATRLVMYDLVESVQLQASCGDVLAAGVDSTAMMAMTASSNRSDDSGGGGDHHHHVTTNEEEEDENNTNTTTTTVDFATASSSRQTKSVVVNNVLGHRGPMTARRQRYRNLWLFAINQVIDDCILAEIDQLFDFASRVFDAPGGTNVLSLSQRRDDDEEEEDDDDDDEGMGRQEPSKTDEVVAEIAVTNRSHFPDELSPITSGETSASGGGGGDSFNNSKNNKNNNKRRAAAVKFMSAPNIFVSSSESNSGFGGADDQKTNMQQKHEQEEKTATLQTQQEATPQEPAPLVVINKKPPPPPATSYGFDQPAPPVVANRRALANLAASVPGIRLAPATAPSSTLEDDEEEEEEECEDEDEDGVGKKDAALRWGALKSAVSFVSAVPTAEKKRRKKKRQQEQQQARPDPHAFWQRHRQRLQAANAFTTTASGLHGEQSVVSPGDALRQQMTMAIDNSANEDDDEIAFRPLLNHPSVVIRQKLTHRDDQHAADVSGGATATGSSGGGVASNNKNDGSGDGSSGNNVNDGGGGDDKPAGATMVRTKTSLTRAAIRRQAHGWRKALVGIIAQQEEGGGGGGGADGTGSAGGNNSKHSVATVAAAAAALPAALKGRQARQLLELQKALSQPILTAADEKRVKRHVQKVYEAHLKQVGDRQEATDYRVNRETNMTLLVFFTIVGFVSFICLGICAVGLTVMQREERSKFLPPNGLDAEAAKFQYKYFAAEKPIDGKYMVLAGYNSWNDFVNHCCCTSFDFSSTINTTDDKIIAVEKWLCENGLVKERLRKTRVVSSILSVRHMCSSDFLNGCTVSVNATWPNTVTLTGCAASVSAAEQQLW